MELYIRRWNDNSPAVDKVKLVADYLHVSLEWLVTGKEADELSYSAEGRKKENSRPKNAPE